MEDTNRNQRLFPLHNWEEVGSENAALLWTTAGLDRCYWWRRSWLLPVVVLTLTWYCRGYKLTKVFDDKFSINILGCMCLLLILHNIIRCPHNLWFSTVFQCSQCNIKQTDMSMFSHETERVYRWRDDRRKTKTKKTVPFVLSQIIISQAAVFPLPGESVRFLLLVTTQSLWPQVKSSLLLKPKYHK